MKPAIMSAIIETIMETAQKCVDYGNAKFTAYAKTFTAEYIDAKTGRFLVDGADCGIRFYEGQVCLL